MTFPPGLEEIENWNEELEEPSGGLPTGWTQDDSDPANVDTNGGNLTSSGYVTSQDDSDGQATLSSQAGVISAPSAGSGTCFTADGGVGATVALDAGGLLLDQVGAIQGATGFEGLTIQQAAGGILQLGRPSEATQMLGDALAFFGEAPVAKPSVTGVSVDPVALSILVALVALGLVTDDT